MPDDDQFPEIMTREQVRFEIDFAVSQVGAATLQESMSKRETRARMSRWHLVETILARFERLQVRRRAPIAGPTDRTSPPP
jgi:hypothetical protein